MFRRTKSTRRSLVQGVLSIALSGLCLGAVAADKVARYGYTIDGYSVMPYAVDPSTGYLRFTAEQDLVGPSCSALNNLSIAPSQKFLYIPDACGSVVASSIAPTGVLKPVTGSPFTVGTNLYQMIIAPSGNFGYVTDISAYPTITIIPVAVDSKTGALSTAAGSVSYSASNDPTMVMDPLGQFLFVFDQGTSDGVYVFAINGSTGALAAVAGSPFSTGAGTNTSLAVYPGGTAVIATNYDDASISVLEINRTTGVLTLAPGSPRAVSGYPYSVAIDPISPHLVFAGYAGNSSSNVSAFRLTAKGKLTEVAGSPFATYGSYGAFDLSVDPTGQYIYALTEGNSGSNWETETLGVNPSTGVITPLQTIANPWASGVTLTTGTTAVSFTPTYAYAANSPVAAAAPDGILEYSIDTASGALTLIGSFPDDNGPRQLILAPRGNYVYASDTKSVTGYNVQSTGALKSVTKLSVAGVTYMLEDPIQLEEGYPYDASFIYTAEGSRVDNWFVTPANGVIQRYYGTYFGQFDFPGTVTGMTTSFGSYGDFVVSSDGTLTEIYRGSNTGAQLGVASAGTAPSAVALDGAGRFTYVANSGDGTISGFVNAGESPQPMNSGTAFPTGTTPTAIAGDPYGLYLYVANSGSHNLWSYRIDPVLGNLTPIGTPVAVGNGPIALNVDYSGKFVYCANSVDGTISTFTINSDGTLTPSGTVVVDSTTPSTPAPTSIVSTGTYQ